MTLASHPLNSVSTVTCGDRIAVPASRYDYKGLADIYNQARVDYIVPMPMNARRMEEYVTYYDVDLDASVVVLNRSGEEIGVGMLGVRENRGWITRVGLTPASRGHHIGQFLMETLLQSAADRGIQHMQLEVIVGNDPAHRLFQKLGFEDYRDLSIIRRPPGPLDDDARYDDAHVTPLRYSELPYYLEQRLPGASWLEETASLLNMRNLSGIKLDMRDGQYGWVIYQQMPLQLAHFVFRPDIPPAVAAALLYHVHRTHRMQDTKIENLVKDDPIWPVFPQFGYLEAFHRIEMRMDL